MKNKKKYKGKPAGRDSRDEVLWIGILNLPTYGLVGKGFGNIAKFSDCGMILRSDVQALFKKQVKLRKK